MKPKNIFIVLAFIFSMVLISCGKDEATNHAPVISSVTVNPSSVNANGVVSVNVVATDADNDQLTYSYVVTGGAITGSGANVSWTAPSTSGAHSLTVTVTDGKGGQASANGALTVLQPVTQITGTARFLAGTAGDLSNAKVSLYTTRDNWNNNNPIKFGAVVGSGANVTFALTNINPGNYYLDVWKDNNNDGVWSAGDFVGVYGNINLGADGLTEVQVSQGQTFSCSIDMFIR